MVPMSDKLQSESSSQLILPSMALNIHLKCANFWVQFKLKSRVILTKGVFQLGAIAMIIFTYRNDNDAVCYKHNISSTHVCDQTTPI